MSQNAAPKAPSEPENNEKQQARPRPFVKWVGGKSQLIPQLLQYMPTSYDRYYEPFVGGGALFFHLQPKKATLIDTNVELITTYKVIKDKLELLIADLSQHVYDQEYYYTIRNVDRSAEFKAWSDVQRASRLIYLNKTCYNGLYRVNSKQQFNTPFGSYTNPTIVDEPNLRACHKALQKTRLIVGSFLQIEQLVTESDFVYFDPPYVPLSATASFTGYSKDGFDLTMQVALKEVCDRLTKRGVRFMLSNSSSPYVVDLYKDYEIFFVEANRAINSKGDKRGKIKEVVVVNY